MLVSTKNLLLNTSETSMSEVLSGKSFVSPQSWNISQSMFTLKALFLYTLVTSDGNISIEKIVKTDSRDIWRLMSALKGFVILHFRSHTTTDVSFEGFFVHTQET
jgi:hypothetical protein